METTIDQEAAPRGRRAARDTEKRQLKWAPPSLLPDPTPEYGYSFRWVRVSMVGMEDSMNISAKLREGYEPVKAIDHPEVQVPGQTDGRFKDCIVIGGLVLCKIPTEIAEQRADYYRNQAKQQMQAVDNNLMSQSDSRMPLFKERKSEVSFGSGRS